MWDYVNKQFVSTYFYTPDVYAGDDVDSRKYGERETIRYTAEIANMRSSLVYV